MTKLAAVDCGTNSLRLLISDVDPVGRRREITREMRIVRVGQGVDATHEINPEAIERAREVLTDYVARMRFEGVERVRMVATSAVRDAKNRDDFFAMTEELLGQVEPGARAEVISGEEEAQLSFDGAVQFLKPERGPFCVIDLGGGSTEFVVGNADGEIFGSHSTQMGCVRLSERIMRADPPTDAETEIARDYIRERLSEVRALVPVEKAKTFVGCAGTFTTLSALAQGLERYDPAAIHGSELNFDALRVITRQLRREDSATRAHNPVMHQGRADVIGAGVVIVEEVMAMIEEIAEPRSFVISEMDILDGIIGDLRARS